MNRVLRAFRPDRFVRVQFRDENRQRIYFNSENAKVLDHFKSVLLHGISVGTQQCEFLATSSSQLRDHGCWMIAPYRDDATGHWIDASFIRKWCGNFDEIRSVSKYVARLAMAFSSSSPSIRIAPQHYRVISDHSVGRYCFTDGIGMISPTLAAVVAQSLQLKHSANAPPTAFQIRFAGYKGVLAIRPPGVVNDTVEDGDDVHIWLRPSMFKFATLPHLNQLEVLNCTMFIPCYLNRQVLLILSALGIPDSVFQQLQNQMLQQFYCTLLDPVEGKQRLHGLVCKNGLLSMLPIKESDFFASLPSPHGDPFMNGLLMTLYRQGLTDLLNKTRIFVPMGRILMGVIDETGTLQEDEVFIQVSQVSTDAEAVQRGLAIPAMDFSDRLIIIKSVAVAKNPCFHPGDLRRLQGVRNAQLERYHCDCIVFPRQGKRPITDMCSGSDLDGDLYWVSWDPALIPQTAQLPLDYQGIAADAPTTAPMAADHVITMTDVAEHIASFMANDQVGQFANAHLAQAEIQPDGVNSAVCRQLAQLFSLAVDSPKTGVIPEFPKAAQVDRWPDYMEDATARGFGASSTGRVKVFFKSEKILGRLYRQVKALQQQQQQQRNPQQQHCFSSSLWDKDEVEEAYQQYCKEVQLVLDAFGIANECEIFAAGLPDIANDERTEQLQLASQQIALIISQFREQFLQAADAEELKKKAMSWYAIACSAAPHPSAPSKEPIYSFAWIGGDYLPPSFPPLTTSDRKSLPFVGLKDAVISLLKDEIAERLMQHWNVLSLLTHTINAELGEEEKMPFSLQMDGSTVWWGIGADSNVDLAISSVSRSNRDLDHHIDRIFAILAESKAGTGSAPFPHCRLEKLHHQDNRCIVNNDDGELPAKFTISVGSSNVANTIRQFIHHSAPGAMILLFMLQWARGHRIVAHPQGVKTALTASEFALIIMELVQRFGCTLDTSLITVFSPPLNAMTEAKLIADLTQRLETTAEVEMATGIVIKIIEFFAFEAIDPNVPGSIPLQEAALCSLHLLAQTHDLAMILPVAQDSTSQIAVPQENSKRKRSVRLLKKVSGPNVAASSIFVKGASLFLILGISSAHQPLSFCLHQARRRPQHYQQQCYSIDTRSSPSTLPSGLSSWQFEEFFVHSHRQLAMARKYGDRDGDDRFGKIKMAIKFGYLYFTSLPRLFIEDARTAVTLMRVREALQKGYEGMAEGAIERFHHPPAPAQLTLLPVAPPPMPMEEDYDGEKDELVDPEIKLMDTKAKVTATKDTSGAENVQRKRPSATMSSAFEPFISVETAQKLVDCFSARWNLSPTRSEESYSCNLLLSSASAAAPSPTASSQQYSVVYDENLQFKRLTRRPVKWLAADILIPSASDGKDQDHLDCRIVCSSIKEIVVPLHQDDKEPQASEIVRLIQEGKLFSLETPDDRPVLHPLVRADETIFLRRSRLQQYRVLANTNPSSSLATDLPNISMEMWQRIHFNLFSVTEYSGVDQSTGQIRKVDEKHELKVSIEMNWSDLEDSQFVIDLIVAVWEISHLLHNIIVR